MRVKGSMVKVKGAMTLKAQVLRGGDRRRNKETWSGTEIKTPWEKSQGRSEPHITVQGNP